MLATSSSHRLIGREDGRKTVLPANKTAEEFPLRPSSLPSPFWLFRNAAALALRTASEAAKPLDDEST